MRRSALLVALVLAMLLVPLAVQAAGPAPMPGTSPGISGGPAQIQGASPGINMPPNLPAAAGIPPGSVAITVPAPKTTWYWGARHQVSWTYTWTQAGVHPPQTTVSLWRNAGLILTIVRGAGAGTVTWTVPMELAPGLYELRVTNEWSSVIEARQPVYVEPGKVTFTAPKPVTAASPARDTWPMGSQQMISWTYEGHPGTLNLVLVNQEYREVIAPSVVSANGWGRQSFTVPAYYRNSPWYFEARRTADNRLVGQSDGFIIPIPEDDCRGTHVSTASAAWGEALNLTGSRLDRNCAVEFKPNAGAAHPLIVNVKSASELIVQVPQYTPMGPGRLRVYPRSGQNPGGFLPVDRDFTVRSPKPGAGTCEAFAVHPQAGNPGTDVILWGNQGMQLGCTVQFTHTPTRPGDFPEVYTAQVHPVDTQRLRAVIPMMPAGVAVVTSRAGQGPAGTVTVTVNEVAPVLTGVSPAAGYATQNVLLLGQAFLPPSKPEYAQAHAQFEDLRVRIQWAANRFDDMVPTHVASPMPHIGPEALLVKLPGHLNAVPAGGFQGSISVYRRIPQLMSAAREFKFEPLPQAAPPASSCPGAQYIQGYQYVGSPRCATGNVSEHPGAYLRCDASGYHCCEPSQGANTKCGKDRWTYPANCQHYCTGTTNCQVGLQVVNGVVAGCYRPN